MLSLFPLFLPYSKQTAFLGMMSDMWYSVVYQMAALFIEATGRLWYIRLGTLHRERRVSWLKAVTWVLCACASRGVPIQS